MQIKTYYFLPMKVEENKSMIHSVRETLMLLMEVQISTAFLKKLGRTY